MAKKGTRYTPEFRRQMVELHRAGRSFEELAKEFGCTVSDRSPTFLTPDQEAAWFSAAKPSHRVSCHPRMMPLSWHTGQYQTIASSCSRLG